MKIKKIKHGDLTLILRGYKEPMKKVKRGEGFGFHGALLFSEDGGLVQCHECGQCFNYLQAHISKAHKIKSRDYREKWGLNYGTALCSEEYRIEAKQRMMTYLASLTQEQKDAHYAKMKDLWKKTGADSRRKAGFVKNGTLEHHNKRGTCPDQLIAKIQEVAGELGRQPSQREFVEMTGGQGYKHLIFSTHGSWNAAIKLAGFTPQSNRRGSVKTSEDKLLGGLTSFYNEYKKIPTWSDFKRGILPYSYQTYKAHFGSLRIAREAAGLE